MSQRKPDGFTFFADHATLGWIAFGIAIAGYLIFIAWYFKREADSAKLALATARQLDSERVCLIKSHMIPTGQSKIISSESYIPTPEDTSDDTWDGEFDSTYLQPSYRFTLDASRSQPYVLFIFTVYLL